MSNAAEGPRGARGAGGAEGGRAGALAAALRWGRGAARTLLMALAWATLAGMLLEPFRSGSAIHVHWLGCGTLSSVAAAAFGAGVLGEALLGARVRWLGWLARGGTGLVLILAARGALRHAHAVDAGLVSEVGGEPNACLLAMIVLLTGLLAGRPGAGRTPSGLGGFMRRAALLAGALGLLVLGWIESAGAVDYSVGVRADAIVVLGSRVYADGTPSGSLVDRTVTACELWKRGAAPLLVLSGGRTPGNRVSEPEAMRSVALAQGLPAAALLLDEQGLTTAATVANVAALSRARGWHLMLAVSHDYHLARLRLLGERARLTLKTVPARETCPRGWKVAAVTREILAWGAAWLG